MLILAQVVGVGAVALYLLSFQLKRRSHIVWVTFVSNALYVLQYLMLGAFSGAALDILSTVSSFFAGKKNAKGFRNLAKPIALVLLSLILITGLALTFLQGNAVGLFSIAGALLQTGALWFQKEQTIRKLSLAGAPFWLIYNFLSRAYGAALGSFLSIISIGVSLYRYQKGRGEASERSKN